MVKDGETTYKLVARTGVVKGMSWTLGQEALVIGRSPDCDVLLRDKTVSRRHCEIMVRDNQAALNELSSTNACLVNGQPAAPCDLEIGDIITIGQSTFLITTAPGEEKATVSKLRTEKLSPADFEYLAARVDESDQSPSGRALHDFQGLHTLSTSFGSSKSVTDATDLLHAFLEKTFAPCACSVYRTAILNAGETLVLVKGNEVTENLLDPLLQQAVNNGEPLLISSQDESGGAAIFAPIIREGILGALLVDGRGIDSALSSHDLRYLAAISRTVAPYLGLLDDYQEIEEECESLRAQSDGEPTLVGASKGMQQLRGTIRRIGASELNVLVLGETGTGKESVARLLHLRSARAQGPYVVVNCAAIPPDLFESEFFGHEAGAFTGAQNRRIGLLEEADGGTVFLDEVGDLSSSNQARLLRAVENGTFRPVGGDKESTVDVRFVCATNRDVNSDVEAGTFREDLYHRLCGFEIHVPALRDRPSDIPVLAKHFLELNLARSNGGGRGIASDALEFLSTLPWRGNARELKNLVDRAVVLGRGEQITIDDIRLCRGGSHERSNDALRSLAEMEKQHIQRVLRECDGDIDEACAILEMGRSTLYRKVKEYGRGY